MRISNEPGEKERGKRKKCQVLWPPTFLPAAQGQRTHSAHTNSFFDSDGWLAGGWMVTAIRQLTSAKLRLAPSRPQFFPRNLSHHYIAEDEGGILPCVDQEGPWEKSY